MFSGQALRKLTTPAWSRFREAQISSRIIRTRSMKTYTITETWLDAQCELGEGPHWDREANTLRFVDIVAKTLHTVNLTAGTSSHRKVQLDFSIGVTAEIASRPEEFVFGGKRGYGIWDKNTGAHRWIRQFSWDNKREEGKADRMRSNDGIVDAKGRFLVGAMTDGEVPAQPQKEGVIFSLDEANNLSRVFEPITIPNGASFSSDNKCIYLTDSTTNTVRKYPYDLETGQINPQGLPSEILFDTSAVGNDLGGVPDGHCRDVDGCFWIAVFGGGAVYRVDPAGQILAKVFVPTRAVTCATICGTELYITTAKEEEPEKYPESVKFQGGVFKVDVGVEGTMLNKFRMPAGI